MSQSSVFSRVILFAMALFITAANPLKIAGQKPKPGEPSYEETAVWIASKLPLMGGGWGDNIYATRYKFVSMDGCVTLPPQNVSLSELL